VLQRQHSENLEAPAAIPPTSSEQSGETHQVISFSINLFSSKDRLFGDCQTFESWAFKNSISFSRRICYYGLIEIGN